MMIKIDPELKTIEVLEKITDTKFYSLIKKMWHEPQFISLFFPLGILNENYCFNNGWRFKDKKSYKHVSPNVLFGQMEEIPILPKCYITYKELVFNRDITTIEELLIKIPKNIPHKSIHLSVSDNSIVMSIGGIWPNEQYDNEQTQFQKDMKRWLAAYQYRKEIFSCDQS